MNEAPPQDEPGEPRVDPDAAFTKKEGKTVYGLNTGDLSLVYAREVARAPGYLRPDDFLALFRFVREKAYETKSFREYVRAARS